MYVWVFQGALLCASCGANVRDFLLTGVGRAGEVPTRPNLDDSDTFPQGTYPNGGGEADSPQHCDRCGEFLENPLTEDGLTYVREALGSRCRERSGLGPHPWAGQYADFYAIQIGSEEEKSNA